MFKEVVLFFKRLEGSDVCAPGPPDCYTIYCAVLLCFGMIMVLVLVVLGRIIITMTVFIFKTAVDLVYTGFLLWFSL